MTWSAARRFVCACCIAIGCGDSGDGVDADADTTSPTITATTMSASDPTTADDTSDGSTGTAGTTTSIDPDTSTGPIETCPDTHVCLAAPPEGWNGPVVRLERPALAPELVCPEAYPDPVASAGADVVAGDVSCTCTCGAASEVQCEVSTQLHYYGVSDDCSDVVPANFLIFATMCNDLPDQFPGFTSWTLDPVLVMGGSCEPMLEQAMDEPTFATALTVCGGAEAVPGCDADEVCAPRAREELCIWQAGDARCPEDYDDRYLYYGTIDDQRTCEACSCDEPVGVCDDAFAYLYDNYCNVPIAGGIAADGECHGTGAPLSDTAALVVGEPTAFCEPSTSVPTGDAIGSAPTTVCCAS
jgi:hypothetical protein